MSVRTRPTERQWRPGSEQHSQPAEHQEVKGEDGGRGSAAHLTVLSGKSHPGLPLKYVQFCDLLSQEKLYEPYETPSLMNSELFEPSC